MFLTPPDSSTIDLSSESYDESSGGVPDFPFLNPPLAEVFAILDLLDMSPASIKLTNSK